MKIKFLAFYLLISSLIVSYEASAQMSAIENLKVLSQQAEQQANLYAQLLASQNEAGQFVFTRNEDIKQNLVANGIFRITDCYNNKQIPCYCINKNEGGHLLSLYRSQVIEGRAYYESYLRALKAVDSADSRLELRTEIEKQKRASAKLNEQLGDKKSQSRDDYAKEHPIKNLINKLMPVFGLGLGLGAPYAFLAIILGPEAIAATLVGLAIVSSTGLTAALHIEEDIEEYVRQQSVHLKAEIDEKNRQIDEQIRLSKMIDKAVLEKINTENDHNRSLIP